MQFFFLIKKHGNNATKPRKWKKKNEKTLEELEIHILFKGLGRIVDRNSEVILH